MLCHSWQKITNFFTRFYLMAMWDNSRLLANFSHFCNKFENFVVIFPLLFSYLNPFCSLFLFFYQYGIDKNENIYFKNLKIRNILSIVHLFFNSVSRFLLVFQRIFLELREHIYSTSSYLNHPKSAVLPITVRMDFLSYILFSFIIIFYFYYYQSAFRYFFSCPALSTS